MLVDAAISRSQRQTTWQCAKRAAAQGQVYNPELGFALVGNTGNGRKYPYNPFYGEFSPRVAVAWSPHFDSDSVVGKIFGHEDTVIRGGYGRQLRPLERCGPGAGTAAGSWPGTARGLQLEHRCRRELVLCRLRVQALGRTASVLGKTPLSQRRPDRPAVFVGKCDVCPNRSILGSITLPPPRQQALDPNFRPNAD